MAENDAFATLHQAIDFAIAREREAQDMYVRFAARTDRQGLRSLFLSMADQEKDHERTLRELRTRQGADSAFAFPAGSGFRWDEASDAAFSPDMSYQDFLLLVIKKEERSTALYLYIEGMCTDEDLKLLFRGLAEEEKRHKSLAHDRYDLEILTEN